MSNPLLSVYNRTDIEFVSGKGCFLKDKNNKKYLDLGAGIAVNSLGYNNPKLTKILKKSACLPWHVSNIFKISGQVELAQKLVDNSCCDQVFFCNSGTEAIEAAIKIVRKYNSLKKSNRNEIITFENAFHGRSMSAISAGGTDKYKEGYEPLLPGFKNVPLVDAEISKFKKYITKNTAAVALEPIQGEGGVYSFSKKFLNDLQKLAKEKGFLIIADEVQCGVGRSGKFFAYQYSNLKPDIICVAKGIGGGFPLGACMAKKEIGSSMTPGTHGGTYGGNPLAMAVGNAVLDQILAKGFIERVKENGDYFSQELKTLKNEFPNKIADILGSGLMIGLKLKGDHLKFVEELRYNGAIAIPAGNNVVRIIPPLNISKKEIDLALKIIKKSLV
jgi:acetylornithine/N-succinyldiaminopimelate aminotransferase